MRNTGMRGRRDGSAVFAVLVVIIIASIVMGTVVASSMQRAFMAHKLVERAKAIAHAEAGASQAYSVLATNFSARTNALAFPYTPFFDGAYDVRISNVNDDVSLIISTGMCGRAVETVIVDARNYGGGGGGGEIEMPNYAILCEGTFYFRGCGSITSSNGTAKLHSNKKLDIRGNCGMGLDIDSSTEIAIGNNITVNGSVEAPILTYKAGKVTVTGTKTVGPVPEQSIPDAQDMHLTDFFNWANQHGEVKGNFSMSGGSYTPNGGVLYATGTVHISSHSVFNGTIIANGNMHISGQADITAGEYGIALASAYGNIVYTSSGTTRGLIYTATGDYSQTANGTVRGQLVIKRNVDKGGNSDVVVYERTVVKYPDSEGGSDLIGISAWQK